MSEQQTGMLSWRRLWLVTVLALAVVAGVVAWAVVDRRDGDGTSASPTSGPVAIPIEPVGLSADGLTALASQVREPIFWAGPKEGYLYELTRKADASVYIRYLPPGVEVGAKGAKYMIVATYPYRGAYDALKKVAGNRVLRLADGGIAVVDERSPKSVHLAYPNVDFQVEVFDPSPAQAREISTSGDVRPVG